MSEASDRLEIWEILLAIHEQMVSLNFFTDKKVLKTVKTIFVNCLIFRISQLEFPSFFKKEIRKRTARFDDARSHTIIVPILRNLP